MGIVSVGAALSEMLLNEKIRALMNYRHIATKNHETGAYKDIFDGDIYHNIYMNQRNLFVSSKDVAVIIFADGFPSKYLPGKSLAIIHCIVMNFGPSVR